MPESKKDLFSDIPLNFSSHPISKELVRKKNRDAVKQSVKSLILTDFYERPFKPNVGCNIRGSLFEPFTQVTKQNMETAIREVIENYEPRAELRSVLVQEYQDNNAIAVTVAFFIKNDPNPVNLDVILERVR